MRKIVIAMFIIGAILLLLDTDDMNVFWLSKLIAVFFVAPSFFVFKFEE